MIITITKKALTDGSHVYDMTFGGETLHITSQKDAELVADEIKMILDNRTVNNVAISYEY